MTLEDGAPTLQQALERRACSGRAEGLAPIQSEVDLPQAAGACVMFHWYWMLIPGQLRKPGLVVSSAKSLMRPVLVDSSRASGANRGPVPRSATW